jgi:hypothetical protein
MKMSLLELFCHVDDFCQEYVPNWERQQVASGQRQRRRQGQLWLSEIMTIVIHFHQVRFRDFKTYYLGYVRRYLSREFPHLVSYNRFVELIGSRFSAIECLSAKLLWGIYGNCVH